VKKETIAALAILLPATALAPQQKEYSLLPGSVPEHALSGWTLRGALSLPGLGPAPRYVLEGAAYTPGADTDLIMHFDSPGEAPAAGDWILPARSAYQTGQGRYGAGAARFLSGGQGLSLSPGASALLAQGSEPGSFSLEFWLAPSSVRDGEQVLRWNAGRWLAGRYESQELRIAFSGGRLDIAAENIFTTPERKGLSLHLKGRDALVPRAWSHHLLRYDQDSGLLEYLMDGRPQALAHASPSGREEAAPYPPMIGGRGDLVLGRGYSGLIDELRISRSFVEEPILRAFPAAGARILSPILDLEFSGSRVASISVERELRGTQGMEFAYRVADTFAGWSEDSPAWIPFDPDAPVKGSPEGRYLQVAINLYPDGNGETSPSLSGIRVSYLPDPPPPPPARLSLVPGDGEILVSWTRVPEADVLGYLVYYGEAPRLYGGRDSSAGPSPVDAGNATSLRLGGLENGKLYYISVVAYQTAAGGYEEGDFSAEACARPLRKAP